MQKTGRTSAKTITEQTEHLKKVETELKALKEDYGKHKRQRLAHRNVKLTARGRQVRPPPEGAMLTGYMSYYGLHGHRSASGYRVNQWAMTCAASPEIPISVPGVGDRFVDVRLAGSGNKWIRLKVIDRGAFHNMNGGLRKIDASTGAFIAIVGSTRPGVAKVEYWVVPE